MSTWFMIYLGIGVVLTLVELLFPTPQLVEDIKTSPVLCFIACCIAMVAWPIGVISKLTKGS